MRHSLKMKFPAIGIACLLGAAVLGGGAQAAGDADKPPSQN